jgi:MOSC domain-containing protein YiiM
VRTSIWKQPVEGPVRVEGVNLAGDAQADRRVHGGPDKAVYAYSRSDLDWWQEQLGRPLPNGIFGENLTIAGMDVNRALIGERWRVGNVLLEVSQPRTPCYKLGIRLGDDTFPDRFSQAGRPGVYLRVLEEGVLRRGAPVVVESRPTSGLTAAEVAHIYAHQPHRAAELLSLPGLAEAWRQWAIRRIAATPPPGGPPG